MSSSKTGVSLTETHRSSPKIEPDLNHIVSQTCTQPAGRRAGFLYTTSQPFIGFTQLDKLIQAKMSESGHSPENSWLQGWRKYISKVMEERNVKS